MESICKEVIDECKEGGWMFSFIGAGEDVLKVATNISIINNVAWEQTSEGTSERFENENQARKRFYDKMTTPCCGVPMSLEERKAMKRRLAEGYYDEDKK